MAIDMPEYTYEDFAEGSAPYEWLYGYENDKFQQNQLLIKLSAQAKKCGIRNFTTLWNSYRKTVRSAGGLNDENVTNFTGQELELNCGEWIADDYGVYSADRNGFQVVACNHPIMPVQRLTNIDTDCEKLKIAYKKRGKGWRSVVVEKTVLASANKIVTLADLGIAVNSENAKYLVRYLTDIEGLNEENIPEISSVGRLGWIGDGQFSPYAEDLVFDGELNYKSYFDAVKCKGNFDKWLEIIKDIRSYSKIAKIAVAASFASVLIQPCNCLPFFLHIWGGSEAGKTVALMVAASVWANPILGEYIHTFNSTAVAQEMASGFVNSLPLMLDELQMIGDRVNFDKMIYQLSEGHGKSRGAKSGGLQKEITWLNCIITTGEQPMTNGSSMGGAVNRIIEIDCKDEKILKNPIEVVAAIRKNYGFAGELFIEKLTNNMDYATSVQKEFYAELQKGSSTEKQIMAASLILAADRLSDEWIFKDGNRISIKDIEEYLSSAKEVSANERAYEFLVDFIAVNRAKFEASGDFGTFEVWGCKEGDKVYFIKSIFDRIMRDNGFNTQAFLSWAKRRCLVETAKGRNTKLKRINGSVSNCVSLIIPTLTDEEADNIEKLAAELP